MHLDEAEILARVRDAGLVVGPPLGGNARSS